MAKEAFDDVGRWRRDREANSRPVHLVAESGQSWALHPRGRRGTTSTYPQEYPDRASTRRADLPPPPRSVVVPSGTLHEGDVILLGDGDEIPADVIIVGSSGETDGSVYVQTANIDGEIDLKARVSLELPQCKQIIMHAPEPSSAVYSFDARLQVDGSDAWRSVGVENTLWAATHVRNVEWVLGLVVYCGNETKLGQNKRLPPTKWTLLERYVNKVVRVIVAVQLLLMLSLGASGYAWERRFLTDAWYLDAHGVGGVGAFVTYAVRFLLLSSLMIPISLKVTMDAFKFMSAKFIDWDLGCYDEATDSPADAISTSLAEDLGQVDHVFCDKTGTLTENVMEFAKASVGGKVYSVYDAPVLQDTLQMVSLARRSHQAFVRRFLLVLALCHTCIVEISGEDDEETESGVVSSEGDDVDSAITSGVGEDADGQPMTLPTEQDVDSAMAGDFRSDTNFWLHDHSYFPDLTRLQYKGQSPDEIALCAAAARNGYAYLGAVDGVLHVAVRGEGRRRFKLLQTLAFTSDRRRMSVIVQEVLPNRNLGGARSQDEEEEDDAEFPEDSESGHYARRPFGDRSESTSASASTSVSATAAAAPPERRDERGRLLGPVRLLCKGADYIVAHRLEQTRNLVDVTQEHLSNFSVDGLRTLLVADRTIPDLVYRPFAERWRSAASQLTGRQDALDLLADGIERHLHLIGATAIEDKLQEHVPETISFMIQAGIRVWVITGDKQETAINIGYSSRLLTKRAPLIRLNAYSEEATRELLTEAELAFGLSSNFWPKDTSLALAIDGRTLRYALSPALRERFLTLADACSAVICCRVTPGQKAAVVRAVRERTGKVTLAIGDGGNDIAMIQAAHVGVGLFGNEGGQAARSADYALRQFSHLGRLMAVHGRYSLLRTSMIINYSLYKNLAFFFAQFIYAWRNGFSGESLYDDWHVTLFNITSTALSPFIMAIFEQDLPAHVLMEIPQLALEQRTMYRLSPYATLGWLVTAIYHSVICYTIGFGWAGDQDPVIDQDGRMGGGAMLGMVVATSTMMVVQFKVLLSSHWIGWPVVGCFALCTVGFFIITLIEGELIAFVPSAFRVMYVMFQSNSALLSIVLAIVAALVPDVIFALVKRTFFPRDWHIIQELYKVKGLQSLRDLEKEVSETESRRGDELTTSSWFSAAVSRASSRGAPGSPRESSRGPGVLPFGSPIPLRRPSRGGADSSVGSPGVSRKGSSSIEPAANVPRSSPGAAARSAMSPRGGYASDSVEAVSPGIYGAYMSAMS